MIGQGAYVVAVEGLDSVPDFEAAAKSVRRNAQRAINFATRRARTEASRAIRREVAFPATYLDSKANGNLRVVSQATAQSLEASITGRGRPTSLARFVKGARRAGRVGPTVEVAPGRRVKMNRAFLMNLRGGNLGLAVRAKPEEIEGKHTTVAMGGGLYLLYGPSVSQVFDDLGGEIGDGALLDMEREFIRLQGVGL